MSSVDFLEAIVEAVSEKSGIPRDRIRLQIDPGNASQNELRLVVSRWEEEKAGAICAFSLTQIYEKHRLGESISDIAEEISTHVSGAEMGEMLDTVNDLEEYAKVRDRLVIRAVNYEERRQRLGKAVYNRIGDIALVLYLKVKESEGSLSSALIPGDLVRFWGREEEDVFQEALLNTFLLFPPRLLRWKDVFTDPDYQGEDFMASGYQKGLAPGAEGNCISNMARVNGAVSVFLPGVAGRLCELMGNDLYMAFTSMHEVMVHNAATTDPAMLREVLKDTIAQTTPACDFLSDKIYRYEKEGGRIIQL